MVMLRRRVVSPVVVTSIVAIRGLPWTLSLSCARLRLLGPRSCPIVNRMLATNGVLLADLCWCLRHIDNATFDVSVGTLYDILLLVPISKLRRCRARSLTPSGPAKHVAGVSGKVLWISVSLPWRSTKTNGNGGPCPCRWMSCNIPRLLTLGNL